MNRRGNFLCNIPILSKNVCFDSRDQRLLIQHKGVLNTIVQRLLKKPRISVVKLDKIGCFVIERIDGKNQVYDIATQVRGEFFEEAEPLYERICRFLKIMEEGNLIGWQKKLQLRE